MMKKTVILAVVAAAVVGVSQSAFAQDIVLENKVKVGDFPRGIVASADGSKCYVPDSSNGGDVYVVNATTQSVTKAIDTDGVRMVYLSPNGSTVWTLDPPGTVVVINTATDAVVANMVVPIPPSNVAFTPDSSLALLYSAGYNPNYLTIVDTATYMVIAQIEVPSSTLYNGIVVTPDSRYALLTSGWANAVTIIDLTTFTITGSIPVGALPLDVVLSRNGARAYVCNYGSMDVSVIDIPTLSLAGRIQLTGKPFRAKYQKGSDFVWVLTDSADVVDVIDTATNTVAKAIALDGIAAYTDLNDIAFRPDGKLVVVTASDTGTVALIDANPANTTFGGIVKSLSAGYVTYLTFLSNGDYVYVVDRTGGYVLICAVSGGLDTLADSITFVIDQLKLYLSYSGLTSDQKRELQKAVDKLGGNNGGSAKNGALQKISSGAIVAGLEKVKQAIDHLIKASFSGLDTSELQKILANGAMNDTRAYIESIEAQVGNTNSYVVSAWGIFNTGVSYLNAGDYYTAVDYFKRAAATAQNAIK